MIEVLNNYLAQHKSINIPGMGTLYLERVPARTDFVNRQLLPPIYTYRFDKYFDAPDKEFFAYLANHQNIPDYEAIKQYNEFAYELRAKVKNSEPAIWEGVGKFEKDENGEIYFEAGSQLKELWNPVPAERVIRADRDHAVLVGDRERTTNEMTAFLSENIYIEKASWWIYALILAALALSLIFFHFYRNNWRQESTGNQQAIPAAK